MRALLGVLIIGLVTVLAIPTASAGPNNCTQGLHTPAVYHPLTGEVFIESQEVGVCNPLPKIGYEGCLTVGEHQIGNGC